jgi:hypothetical protein
MSKIRDLGDSAGMMKRGSTANRPASANTGDMYFDTSTLELLTYKNSAWSSISAVPNAPTSVSASLLGSVAASVSFTAPTNVTISSYTVTSSPGNITASGSSSPITVSGLSPNTSYTFTVAATGSNGIGLSSSATNSITTGNPPTSIEALRVAGGGGSGAGGGGGGGVVYSSSVSVASAVSYTVTVGAGGVTGGAADVQTTPGRGGAGSNSNITGGSLSLTAAVGGGQGGIVDEAGFTGGSGGGAGGGYGSTKSGGTPTSGQGFAGGAGVGGGYPGASGGGGGAGAAGNNAVGGTPGAGGVGTSTYSAWGAATSSGQNVSGTYYYAGGGGGSYFNGGDQVAAGGSGGGGSGVPYDFRNDTTNYPTRHGLANTGGGGGGVSAGRTGAGGGSGIVIIRYSSTFDDPSSYSGTKYVSGGYKYFKFTSTGSVTF